MVMNIRILLGCEESQAVTIAFREIGIEAYSCDIKDCSGDYPEWHIKGDLLEVIQDNWTAAICFPPCTHLAVSGAAHFAKKIADGRQKEGVDFFMKIAKSNINHFAIENPIGIMSRLWRKPNQIIHPYFFGDEAQKSTCLWLKNLPLLYHNSRVNLFDTEITHVGKGEFFEWTDGKTGKLKKQPQWYADAFYKHGTNSEMRQTMRSKTFPGIANAMATQWGNYLKEKYQ
jgi:hypothetical protein